MKKPSTMTTRRVRKLQDQRLTMGLDLGDRSSFYCVLNEAGEVIVEEKVTTSPEAMMKTQRNSAPRHLPEGKPVRIRHG